MQLWQLDITGSVFVTEPAAAGGVREVKLISGIDDHSRYCVIATVTEWATSRAVCTAFLAALDRFRAPERVLTDNGIQFTSRFRHRAPEVLFDQICRRNGIDHLLTKIRSPTTTGKRWSFLSENGNPPHQNTVSYWWHKTRTTAGFPPSSCTTSGTSTPPADRGRLRRRHRPTGARALSATVTLITYAHLWPTAEDRTRAGAAAVLAAVLGAADEPLAIESAA